MRRQWHKWIRKSHRYLGVLIGIQFFAWTVGGLYFSWTDLDKVHGSDRLGPAPKLSATFRPAPLGPVVEGLSSEGLAGVDRIDLITYANDRAVFRVSYHDLEDVPHSVLVDASTGQRRGGLSIREAEDLVVSRYTGPGKLVSSRILEATGPRDEYRELPLPSFAFIFDDERKTTIYVAPNHARITAIRNGNWRIFDFLWMLHTMDYEGRDNFNNYLLQAFAAFGILTLLSGFALFFISSRVFRIPR